MVYDVFWWRKARFVTYSKSLLCIPSWWRYWLTYQCVCTLSVSDAPYGCRRGGGVHGWAVITYYICKYHQPVFDEELLILNYLLITAVLTGLLMVVARPANSSSMPFFLHVAYFYLSLSLPPAPCIYLPLCLSLSLSISPPVAAPRLCPCLSLSVPVWPRTCLLFLSLSLFAPISDPVPVQPCLCDWVIKGLGMSSRVCVAG